MIPVVDTGSRDYVAYPEVDEQHVRNRTDSTRRIRQGTFDRPQGFLGNTVLCGMTKNGDDTLFPIPLERSLPDEFVLSRRWQRFFLTVAGLIAFIVLAASLRTALS